MWYERQCVVRQGGTGGSRPARAGGARPSRQPRPAPARCTMAGAATPPSQPTGAGARSPRHARRRPLETGSRAWRTKAAAPWCARARAQAEGGPRDCAPAPPRHIPEARQDIKWKAVLQGPVGGVVVSRLASAKVGVARNGSEFSYGTLRYSVVDISPSRVAPLRAVVLVEPVGASSLMIGSPFCVRCTRSGSLEGPSRDTASWRRATGAPLIGAPITRF